MLKLVVVGLALGVAFNVGADRLGNETRVSDEHSSSGWAAHGEPDSGVPSAEDLNSTVEIYCVRCHSDRRMTGNLSLEGFDLTSADQQAEVAERMINKIRASMMPPPGARRPGGDTLVALVESIERVVDEAAAAQPNAGQRRFQRLNRAEYERAIDDLLGLRVDASEWLPQDMLLANFDNMAVTQTLSSTLLEAYLTAANEVSRLALGHPEATRTSKTYRVPVYASQHAWDRVDGAPYGTRGGLVVDHHFPVSGEYVFDFSLWAGDVARFEDLDVSVDGERVALVPLEVLHEDADLGPNWTMRTEPVFVESGQRRLAAAFIRRIDGPYDDVLEPHDWSLAGTRAPVGYGVTLLPHLRDMTIVGPTNTRGLSETEARQRIFTCRPVAPEEARSCARQIVRGLAERAYRRPSSDRDLEGLMDLYDLGAQEGRFEGGIRTALEAILASPQFIFRLETQPEDVDAGETYEVSDLALASRLSFFLWGGPPDAELIRLAEEGNLSSRFEEQVRRMLADPRSEALATRFASQWLRLPDLDRVRPDAFWYPYFSEQLADDMRRETEIFFDHLVREDRSLLELYDADYSFMNRRLAEHYGISATLGDEFEQVAYPESSGRKGILGHGSVLMLTSMGNRTSPVLRGKWVMEVLLNTPPPPPPPGVPDLEETEGTEGSRVLTTRERLEQHRANPTCNSCHRFMDPIGVAMENFGVTGRWRIRENGSPVDTQGELYDGTMVSSPAGIADALLERPLPLVRAFTMNLMAYAIGRRVEYYDQPAIRRIARNAEQEGYRLSSFIIGVLTSDAFRKQVADGPTEAAQGAESDLSNLKE